MLIKNSCCLCVLLYISIVCMYMFLSTVNWVSQLMCMLISVDLSMSLFFGCVYYYSLFIFYGKNYFIIK